MAESGGPVTSGAIADETVWIAVSRSTPLGEPAGSRSNDPPSGSAVSPSDAGEGQRRAVGYRDVTAVPVDQDGAVTDDIVQIVPGGQPPFGQPLVVETLADHRAFHPTGEIGDPLHDLAQIGGVHQLQTGDERGVTQRVEVVVVIHQRRCSGIESSTI